MYHKFMIFIYLQFQQAKARDFCSRLELNSTVLDVINTATLSHLLVNKKDKVIFCAAPKVGCTNMKLLFYVAQGR